MRGGNRGEVEAKEVFEIVIEASIKTTIMIATAKHATHIHPASHQNSKSRSLSLALKEGPPAVLGRGCALNSCMNALGLKVELRRVVFPE